jgi:hypothetical protein
MARPSPVVTLNRIRYRRNDAEVFIWAFDLIELNGDDLRRDAISVREAMLESLLARPDQGIRFNEHLNEQDGPLVSSETERLHPPLGGVWKAWPARFNASPVSPPSLPNPRK